MGRALRTQSMKNELQNTYSLHRSGVQLLPGTIAVDEKPTTSICQQAPSLIQIACIASHSTAGRIPQWAPLPRVWWSGSALLLPICPLKTMAPKPFKNNLSPILVRRRTSYPIALKSHAYNNQQNGNTPQLCTSVGKGLREMFLWHWYSSSNC